MILAWENKRSSLHHGWMQNSYLSFLNARKGYLDGALIGNEKIREDILSQFSEWGDKKSEILGLINETVENLSPRQLLDEHPLTVIPEESKVWLKEVVHALYLERTHIEDSVVDLKKRFDDICDIHTKLMRLLKGENGALRAEVGDAPFKRFRDMVQEFSRRISALPHEVQVI